MSILDHQVNDTIKRVETKTCFKYPEREYLRGASLNDTIKRVETKTCFKYPEREYLRDFYRKYTAQIWRLAR